MRSQRPREDPWRCVTNLTDAERMSQATKRIYELDLRRDSFGQVRRLLQSREPAGPAWSPVASSSRVLPWGWPPHRRYSRAGTGTARSASGWDGMDKARRRANRESRELLDMTTLTTRRRIALTGALLASAALALVLPFGSQAAKRTPAPKLRRCIREASRW